MKLARTNRYFGFLARISAAVSLTLFGLAIVAGSLGLDSAGAIGTVLFPALGIATLIGGVGALFTGITAMLREHDLSAGTILATAAGALLSWFMIFELIIE